MRTGILFVQFFLEGILILCKDPGGYMGGNRYSDFRQRLLIPTAAIPTTAVPTNLGQLMKYGFSVFQVHVKVTPYAELLRRVVVFS